MHLPTVGSRKAALACDCHESRPIIDVVAHS
jgi:hypothetical protein